MKRLLPIVLLLLCLPVCAETLKGGADDDNCDWLAYERGWPEPQGEGWGWVCVYDHEGNFKFKYWKPYTAKQLARAIARGKDTKVPKNWYPKTWAEIQASGGLTPLFNVRVRVKDVAEVERTGIIIPADK